MLDKVQQLIEEMESDHFRASKRHNGADLYDEVFSLYEEDIDKAVDKIPYVKGSGSKVSSMLMTQNLLLLKRVIKLEERLNEIESSRD